jgi:hypothetical protein
MSEDVPEIPSEDAAAEGVTPSFDEAGMRSARKVAFSESSLVIC